MSKRNRGRRGPRRQPAGQATDLDIDALGRLAAFRGFATNLWEGEPLPVVDPHGPIDDFMDFDREMCAAGLKLYLRPVTAGEYPEHVLAAHPSLRDSTHVVVREIRPGLRMRTETNFVLHSEVN